MDAGCTCCCTCSTGFNNNPTGRKNRWHTFNTSKHTFLLDWWNSDWLPIPHCEPDAVLSLESLMRSLCCLEQMLRVTQVAPSTMSTPSLLLTDWHVYWHVFWQNATYLAYSYHTLSHEQCPGNAKPANLLSQPWNVSHEINPAYNPLAKIRVSFLWRQLTGEPA